MMNGGVRKSRQVLVHYAAVMEMDAPKEHVVEHNMLWTPPRVGCFKINVDGATFAKKKYQSRSAH